VRIEPLSRGVSASDLDELAELLCDAVASGATLSLLSPLTREQARGFWCNALERTHQRSVTLVARDARGVAGSVQLQPAGVQNQPHRAEVSQLLVHRRARGRGVARALMAELEKWAALGGFTLLTLDTRRGDAAERLYRASGWTPAGTIPGYALDPHGNAGDAIFFYKQLPIEPSLALGSIASRANAVPRANARAW
jgi:ribosomal protein S18 acetylase RimI-like enzyme